MKKITILDYGMGNVRSLYNAFNYLGYNVNFCNNDKKIESNFLVLPGVGAFSAATNLLKKKKIDINIKDFAKSKSNFILGICLGMQLLFTNGNEGGREKGLGLIGGSVEKIDKKKSNLKLPNIGWSKINIVNNSFLNIDNFNNTNFYFIHSYVGIPNKNDNIIANSNYKQNKFCSIVTNQKNILGTQFHPEKSGENGLEFLKNLVQQTC